MFRIASSFLAICTATAFLVVAASPASAAPVSAEKGQGFILYFTSGNPNGRQIGLNLAVKATSSDVEPVGVNVATCSAKQQPFRLVHRTRHMLPGIERLITSDNGQNLQWQVQSMPSPSAHAKQLHLQILLPPGGGRNYCLAISAETHTVYTTKEIDIVWGTA